MTGGSSLPESRRLCAPKAPAGWVLPLLWLLIGIAATVALPAAAQTLDAFHWPSGTVELGAGWREHNGDNPAWARPEFDDSSWRQVELDDLGAAQPGWRWYRLHLKLAPGHSHVHVLIEGGDGTYALFVNGRKMEGPELRSSFGVRRPIEQVISPPGDADDLVLALRTFTPTAYAAWHLPLFMDASLGTPGAIDNERAAMESQRLYAALPSISINLLLILSGLGAFALYRSQRNRSEYLWLGLYLALLGASNLFLFLANTGVAPLSLNMLVADPLIYFFTIMQIEFTFSFAGQRVKRGWRIYEALLLAPLIPAGMMWCGLFPSSVYALVEALAILPAALLLPVLLFLWYRGGNREAGWLILPSLLPLATAALNDIGTASIIFGWGRLDFLANPVQFGPIPLQVIDLGDLLFLLAIAVVMFFRFTRVSREQARAAAELDTAREMQEQMVPASLPSIAGYDIQAAYRPAEEVGGDFYYVSEQRDGSALIALGDVSGKGLRAAMTVSAIIGALRTMPPMAPAGMLTALNRGLSGRQNGGFVTCCVVRIEPDGGVTAANAGHLSPYLNGEELALDPNLPLGLASEVDYSESRFALQPGDTLVFLSDGVVEARNAGGELFGFEGARRISRESAERIAQAAHDFGQEDDITVFSLTRTGNALLVP